MASVDDLREGGKDPAGNDVRKVLRRVSKVYAVYRTDTRVMIHYSDDAVEAEAQRTRLAPIAALRGQIAGMVHDWYNGASETRKQRAECYDERVADALVIAFENDVPVAATVLEEIRDEIIGRRTALARSQYLGVAGGVAIGVLLLAWAAAPLLTADICRTPLTIAQLINGVIGGTIGAFLSIATGLRTRTVLTDLQFIDNSLNALLRMLIGTIGGGVAVCLALSGVIGGLEFDTASVDIATGGWLQLLVLGLVAGFSERMVPDLLAKGTIVLATPGAKKDAAVEAAAAAKPGKAGEQGRPGPGADVDAVDSCLCDAPPAPGEALTADEDLPPTEGGVRDGN